MYDPPIQRQTLKNKVKIKVLLESNYKAPAHQCAIGLGGKLFVTADESGFGRNGNLDGSVYVSHFRPMSETTFFAGKNSGDAF